jgi:uncharacterized protein (TIGR03086 family)
VDQLAAHLRAQDVFGSVLANAAPERLSAPSPCQGWDAQGVIDHVVAGNQLVLRRAGLEPVPLPDDARAAHSQSAAAAHAVFAAPGGLTRVFDTAAGSIPGTVFISLRTIDALVHGWDLAVATGQRADLDPELAAELLVVAKQLMSPQFRGPGRSFADEQPCPDDRPPADQLAAFLGRAIG